MKDLFAEFVDQLIKAEIELSFDFIVQELFAKMMEGVMS